MNNFDEKYNIIHLVSNKVWGGGEQYVYNLCRYFSGQGCKVSVYTRPIKALTERFSQLDVTLGTLPLKGVLDIRSAFLLAKQLRGGVPFVIHVHNFKDAFTAVYAKILSGNNAVKVVVTRHLAKKGKDSFMYRWLYRNIDGMIFVSELAKERFMQGVKSFPQCKSSVILNSIVVPQDMQSKDIRNEIRLADGCVLMMYHGRIAAEKGLDTLVEAMRTVPSNVVAVLIGTGDKEYEADLMEKADNYGLQEQVVLAGFRYPVLPYLQGCHFGVLPSIAEESSSLTCMEYLSQGRAVIATDNGGQREYLTHGSNSLLVPPGNARLLADAITKLATDEQLRESMGVQAKNDFTALLNFDLFVVRVADVYKKLFID